jgi:lysophospholipase L1-like esterase
MEPRKRNFTINQMGFRGDTLQIPKPEAEFRIFMIGGSTAEGFYLDDSEALHSIVQSELRKQTLKGLSIRLYNAGKSGDASNDHVSILVHRVVHLEPDMLIVFAGINDLSRSIYNHDYLHYGGNLNLAVTVVATDFQIPRRIYYLIKRFSATDRDILERITGKSSYRGMVALQKKAPESDRKPRVDLASYRRNLQTIIGAAKAHGIQLVLMTQQTTWNSTVDPQAKDWQWLRYRAGVTYREDLMDHALEAFNAVMRELARDHGIPLYDLAQEMPKSSEFFYDDVHFNVKGAELAGKRLSSYIVAEALIPR